MRQAKALNDLRFAFDYRLLRLELLAKTAAQLEDVEKRREAGYLAVELHNCWVSVLPRHLDCDGRF